MYCGTQLSCSFECKISMISAKLVIMSVIVLFSIALTGIVLLFFNQPIGRLIATGAIFFGAFIGFTGGLALMLGKLKNDIHD